MRGLWTGLAVVGGTALFSAMPPVEAPTPRCGDRVALDGPCLCGDREIQEGFCCGGLASEKACVPFAVHGYGAATVGGSFGQRVVVNTLDGSKRAKGPDFACPGERCSIREAISRPNRHVSFGVSGTIVLEADLVLDEPNVTVDGSTAPNQGIQIRSDTTRRNPITVRVRANEIIIRHLRFRQGTARAPGDGLAIEQGRQIVLDHVSCQWASDECISISGYAGRSVRNVTIQHSLIAEVFDHAIGQGKKKHSYSATVGGNVDAVTYYRNVFALNRNRNPQLTPGSQGRDSTGYEDEYRGRSTFEVVENVVYGYDVGSFVGAASPDWRTHADFIRNVYIAAPGVTARPQIPIQILVAEGRLPSGQRAGPVSVFLEGNRAWSRIHDGQDECEVFLDRRSSGNVRAACHNWEGEMFGVRFASHERGGNNRFPTTATDSLERVVLPEVGASLPCRDPVDRRIAAHVEERSGRLIQSDPREVGGYPDLTLPCGPTR